MRNALATLLTLTVLAPFAPAQQTFELWPGRTTFTSRGNIGVGSGETLQGVHATHHRGLGDNRAACVLPNFVGMLQDQNAASRETFHWVVRAGSDANGPGADSASLLAQVGPLQTPKSTTNSPFAWSLTTSITKAVQLKDCRSHFSFGIRLGVSPGWTRDGLSTHTTFGSSRYPHQGTHPRAEDHAWQILSTATVATHTSNKRTWRYGLRLDNGVLQLGNGGAMYGMGGMFPAANKPVTARARFGTRMSGGTSVLYLSTGRMNGVILLPNTTRLYLDGTFYVVSSRSISVTGEATHTISSSLPAACAGSPRHFVQAVAIKGGVFVVTNLHAINP
jgi:hypothetical protein